MRLIYIYLCVLSISIVACTSLEDMTGTVTLAIDENIIEPVSVEVESKSGNHQARTVTQSEIDDFVVAVEGTDIKGRYGDVKGQSSKLRVGTYTAVARSNEDDDQVKTLNDGYGSPCYAGSTLFEVKPLEKDRTVVIECKVSNARVLMSLSDDFKDYYDESRTTVSICESESFASRELSMIPSAEYSEAYYTAGDPVYVKVRTSKNGATSAVTYVFKAITAVNACTSYNVSLSVDKDSVAGGITFTVAGSDITTNDILSIESYKAPAAPPVEDN